MNAEFDFHGCRVCVSSDNADLLDQVGRDFAWFAAPPRGQPSHRIDLVVAPPPFDGLPPVRAAFTTPRNVCFRDGARSYLDFFGHALAVLDRDRCECTVYGTDPELLHEIAYLQMLSIVGQHLDARGLHRVHALAGSYRGRGLILMLPSGGGKSTMALALLRNPDFRLLAEDTPFVDRRATILPFPLRIGVRPGEPTGAPAHYIRTLSRMEFDPKTVVDIDFFRGRIGVPTAADYLFVGLRSLGTVSEIRPLSRIAALRSLVNHMVVGLGVHQGLEYLLERGGTDLLGMGGVVASRLRNALALVRRSSPHLFVLGRDLGKNYRTITAFLDAETAETGAFGPGGSP
jgi:hypothetical protein